MNSLFKTVVCVAALFSVVSSKAQTLAELQQDYVDQEFGMFLHFNMGTFTGEEWASPSQPVNTFNPAGLDTDQWAAAAASAGMTYAVLTTKHHDGFALWNTSQSTYDVASTTWAANEIAASRDPDIVKRFSDSFRAQGINVCLYYSIWDRTNGIDGTLNATDATNYVKAELTELLTNYGHITCIWTDGWGWQGGYNYVNYTEVYNHIKTLSPNTLLVENNHAEGDGDIRTWEQNFPTPGYTYPSEASATIRADNKWFFSAGADSLKTTGNIIAQRLTCNERSASFLLDVTPNQSGQIPASQVATLAQIGTAASASTVNWSPAFEIVSAADIDLSGQNILAYNGGNEPVTIGGTTFENFTGVNFAAVSAQPAGQNTTASVDIKSFAGDAGVYSIDTGSSDLNALLDTHIYTDTAVDLTTTLTGLTIGQWYRIQVIAQADDRTGSGTLDRTLVIDGTRLIHRYADLNGDSQRHVTSTIGTVQATDTTLDIVTSSAHGGGWSSLIVSEIEDPTSTPQLTGPTADSISAISAQAHVALGQATADMTVFWDTVDQATGTWSNSNSLGTQVIGPVTGAITGLTGDTQYFYRFYAINTNPDPDTESWSATASFATALTGKAPDSASATPFSKTEIDVLWTDSFETETGFVIQRSPNGTDSWVQVGTASADDEFFYDSGLLPGTTYYYRIFAQNGAGLSDPSGIVNATTPEATPGISVEAWYQMGDSGQGASNLPVDSSGNNRHFTGSINSGTISSAGGGYNNDAYYTFNGSDQGYYGTGYDAPEDNVGIEIWVRTSDLAQTNHHIFGTGSNVNGINIGYDAGGNRGWFGAIAGIAFVGNVGTANYTAGDWIHLAVVRNNGIATFYVNGVASGTSATTPNDATVPHMAVNAGGAVGAYFGGDIGEARIFSFDPGQFNASQLLYPGVTPTAPYGDWTSGFPGLADPDFEVDFENDGLQTGIEWVVGGDPTANDTASVAPSFDNVSDPDNFLFTFRRRDAAEADPATTIVVEYGSDLAGWRNTTDHAFIDGVTIDDSNDLGGGFHQVTVSIPRRLATGSKLFARLRAEINP